MRKTAKLPKNVIPRSGRFYIRVPADAKTRERRRLATWISVGPGGAQAAAAVLARVENLIAVVPPRWDLLNALHSGVVTLRELDALLVTQGLGALEQRVATEARRLHEERSLLALAHEWPALCPTSTELPEAASIKLRRTRVDACAVAIGTVGKLTTAAIQTHLATRGNPATQRSHRNDIAMFCDWLVTQGIIAANPAKGVVIPKAKLGESKIKFREFPDLMDVYNEMTPGPARDAFGFMNATAAETSICERIIPEHADRYREVNVPGRKNEARNRQAVIEAWFVPRWKELLANTPSGTPLMPASRFKIADEVRAAVQRLIARDADRYQHLHDLRPYDARHSWAARWLRDKGATIGMVSGQLGHVNHQMVIKHYGRWIPKTAALMALDPEAGEGQG